MSSAPYQAEPSSRGGSETSRSHGEFPAAGEHLQELHESKQELILKVQALKKELQEWRGRMEGQVKSYKAELAGLQQSLQSDVQGLREDLQAIKQRIRSQLGTTDELIGSMHQRGDPVTRRLAAAVHQSEQQQQQQQLEQAGGGLALVE